MGIRLRLTLIFTSILVAVLAVSGLILVLVMRSNLRSTIDTSLRSRADAIAGAAGLGKTTGRFLIERDEAFAQIIGASGEVEESSPGLPKAALLRGGAPSSPEFFERDVTLEGETFPARFLAVRMKDGRTLLVGASLEDQMEAITLLAGLLLVGGPIIAGVGAGIVWSITGAALSPVERLRQEADAISVSELGRQLTLPDTDDEIARLGRSLNGLLARLAEAFKRERRFVDDASHELRTPVGTLKAELELALSESTTSQEMRSAIERALSDVDYLALLTEDLLVLARSDGGRLPIRKSVVDLGDLVDQAVAGFRHRAESLGTAFHVDVDGTWHLDPLRLRQVLNNLIDNALRHSEGGTSVSLRTSRSDGKLIFEISDSGPGFSSEALEALGKARSEKLGSGLGLSIVASIVEAHGGTMEIAAAPGGGARVRLRFPSSEI